LVKPGDPVEIPITRAITVGGMDPLTENNDIEIKALWVENSVVTYDNIPITSGSGNERKFTVTTSNNKGNAVITLKKDGIIYWSWHIWVVDPDEIGTWTNEYNNIVMMNRHLGATEPSGSGYAYEWGRKDPFVFPFHSYDGYSEISKFNYKASVDDKNPTKAGAINGVIQAIRNPTTLFNNCTNNYVDWLPLPCPNLWNAKGNIKSVHDPCPVNWRVPIDTMPWEGYPLSKFVSSYMKPGIIGSLGDYDWGQGYHGCWWTALQSTNDSTLGVTLWLNEVAGTGFQHYNKANANNVRCVEE
jgi:hypothetical protein